MRGGLLNDQTILSRAVAHALLLQNNSVAPGEEVPPVLPILPIVVPKGKDAQKLPAVNNSPAIHYFRFMTRAYKYMHLYDCHSAFIY